jgi:hypothetical protein
MKASGSKISDMVVASKSLLTETLFKVSISKENPTVEVFTLGPTEKSTTASGGQELKMDTESGKARQGTLT